MAREGERKLGNRERREGGRKKRRFKVTLSSPRNDPFEDWEGERGEREKTYRPESNIL